MSRVVFLDAGPLALVTNPEGTADSTRCAFWLRSLAAHDATIVVSEVADYEVRRELIRARKSRGLRRLDELNDFYAVQYLPITTPVMRRAAELWATARQQGKPTADPHALDADVILAAQAQLEEEPGSIVSVATTNARHLSLFVHAEHWQRITV